MRHKTQTRTKKSMSELERENERLSKIWRIRVKEVMQAKKLSQRKLAEQADLGSTTIRHLLSKAETVSIETLKRICDAVDVPLQYVLGDSSGILTDMTERDPFVPKRFLVLPVHKSDEKPGTDNGHDYIAMCEKDVGAMAYALEMSDRSMEGTGSNFALNPAHVIMQGDAVVYRPAESANIGDLVVLDISQTGKPKYSVRILEAGSEAGEYIASSTTPGFSVMSVSLDKVVGVVLCVLRRV